MAVASGIAAQLGFAAESAYGTYGTPSKFMRGRSYSIDAKGVKREQGTGIQAGSFGPLAAHYVETTKGYAAKVSTDLQTRGLGLLLQGLMGPTTTPSILVTGSAYGATFTLGDTIGKYVTLQVGAPATSGTVVPQNLLGCKVTGADFKIPVDGIATVDFDLDARSHNSATNALVSASYSTTTNVFHGGQLVFKMGTYSSESVVSVKSVGISVKRPHDDARYYSSGSGLKSEPILNGLTEISLDVEADFDAVATFQNVALATSTVSVVVELTGALITGSTYDLFRFTIPSVTFEPAIQDVSGVGVLSKSWKATWRYDGTYLPTIFTQSADSAL